MTAPGAGGARDSFGCRRRLSAGGREFAYFSLEVAEAAGLGGIARLPVSLKILLENMLRHEDGTAVTADDMRALAARGAGGEEGAQASDIAFRPGRILTHDLSGIPLLLDMAAMREAVAALGGDPARVDPVLPVDLVIDHSVRVDHFGSPDALAQNQAIELARNGERYGFLEWAAGAFGNVRLAPPGTGICHQVNLEYLASVVAVTERDGEAFAYPDTLLGTDSHTPMVNALGVLGWGVGGIEAQAAMLGEAITLRLPETLGVRLGGAPAEGVTATDLVLSLTEMLRRRGVVGKFVEFFGPGLGHLPLADRATIANMAPEYGATCALFPIDRETLRYLENTGREEGRLALVEAYAKAQGMWHDDGAPVPVFGDVVGFDLSGVEASLAGPRRPQDRVPLGRVAEAAGAALVDLHRGERPEPGCRPRDGDVVTAAITSCTNTANPVLLAGAGLLARKARARGLASQPWVKTSLTPGSRVVADFLSRSGLQDDLDVLGFHVAGFGCATCCGNSGPLPAPVARAIEDGGLAVGAVISGNRNFEGRVHPQVRMNFLASPALVVAYAIAGSLLADLEGRPLGEDGDGAAVYLRDIWPTSREIEAEIGKSLSPDMFRARYGKIFGKRGVGAGAVHEWESASTYIKRPPLFDGVGRDVDPPGDLASARILMLLGDGITTDHISPVGPIAAGSPAARYLEGQDVAPAEFNVYGARRANHEVMMRGLFANIRIRNEMVPGTEGGVTRHLPGGEEMAAADAALRYRDEGVPLVVVAGREYGTGSSRDWAAKGARLLGIRAVIAESFERIHRSNLVGMGVLPLQFPDGVTRKTLGLDGGETVDITGIDGDIVPRMQVRCRFVRPDGTANEVRLLARLDTAREAEYYRHGGILPCVLRGMLD